MESNLTQLAQVWLPPQTIGSSSNCNFAASWPTETQSTFLEISVSLTYIFSIQRTSKISIKGFALSK